MSNTYIISIDRMQAIVADSEREAFAIAKEEFIKLLQENDADLIVIEEEANA